MSYPIQSQASEPLTHGITVLVSVPLAIDRPPRL